MNDVYSFFAAIAQCVSAGVAYSDWKEHLRAGIVQWSRQNRITLNAVAIMLINAVQTPNGIVLIIRVMGMTTNGMPVHIDDIQAPYGVGEAFGLIFNGYPTNKSQVIFNYNQLYAPFR